MMDQTRWAGLSVQAFFQGYNWLGATPQLDRTVTESETRVTVPSLLCLKLQDFLNQGNWQGLAAPAIAASETSPALTPERLFGDAPASLRLSVFDFFRQSNWPGQGTRLTAAPDPPKKSISLPNPANAEIDLIDLSALF